MAFNAVVIQGVEKAAAGHDPRRWQDALERALPIAYQPVLSESQSRAPRGRTGKLAASVRLQIRRISQGLIAGIEVLLGTGVRYGHLVERGHQIIPRGPSRSGRLTRGRRAELRSGLKVRRAQGAVGFVPGRPFMEPVAVGQHEQTVARVEDEMRRILGL